MKSVHGKGSYHYEYPKADNTVDIVVFGLRMFGLRPDTLDVLLIRRRDDPFKGHWAIPGGYVNIEETLEDAARRELKEETSAEPTHLEQLYTFGDPGRDPRGRVISVAYMALVRPPDLTVQAGDDAAEAKWFPVNQLPPNLAFDHARILEVALNRLRTKTRWQPLGVGLLPDTFTLADLQRVYEVILGRPLDKRNFRRRVLSFGVLKPVEAKRNPEEGGLPAQMFQFDQDQYQALSKAGIDFEV